MVAMFKLGVASVELPEDRTQDTMLKGCLDAIKKASMRGADLVLLPEEPDICSGMPPGSYVMEQHPFYLAFQDAAAHHHIGVISTLSVGTPQHYANTGFLLDRSGEAAGVYRKKHPAPTEEAILTEPIIPGDPFPVFDYEGVKVAIAICMDIHFPEMFRIYGLKGADIVCISTMYLDYTGDMLESIEKARAIDSGTYFALSRYITKPFLAGKSMGYAKVIAPDGRVIVSTGHRDGIAVAEFDPKWRMPFWGEGYGGNLRTMFEMIRRPDLYGELILPAAHWNQNR